MRQGCLDASIASGHLDMHRGIEACIKVCVEASSRFSVEASRLVEAGPPPPITIDAAVGRHALVPASIWPTYTCSEHDGRGWEVLIRHTDKRIRAVLVSFVADRNAAGKRYPKEWLLLESLLPL